LIKETTDAKYEKLASLIDILGDPNTLKILDQASTGFESKKEKIEQLEITPRKYYRSLRKLYSSGLIVSFENKYKLSSLGEFMHKIIFNDASTYLFEDQTLLEPLKEVGKKIEIRIINNYRDLTSLLSKSIEKSNSQILLATRYVDLIVVQSIIFALQRNVKVKTITNEKVDFSSFIKLVGGFLKNIRPNALKFVAGQDNYRVGDVPFSFIIVDDEITIFEIPDKEFQLAFVSTHKEVANSLSHLFWETWKASKTLRIPSL
jgi:hypothetical protein